LGSRYISSIKFNNEMEVEAEWLNISVDKLSYLLNEQSDTSDADITAINYIKIQDKGRGAMEGLWLGLALSSLAVGLSAVLSEDSEKGPGAGYAGLLSFGIGMALGITEGGDHIYYFKQTGK
jgi:hypothetical protein